MTAAEAAGAGAAAAVAGAGAKAGRAGSTYLARETDSECSVCCAAEASGAAIAVGAYGTHGAGGRTAAVVTGTVAAARARRAPGVAATARTATGAATAAAAARGATAHGRTGSEAGGGGVLLGCRCSILLLCFLANRNPRAASVLTWARWGVNVGGTCGAGTGGAGEACRAAPTLAPGATRIALGISRGAKVTPGAGPRAMAARGSPTAVAATVDEGAAAADAAIAAAVAAPGVWGVAAAAAAAAAADMGGRVVIPVCCVGRDEGGARYDSFHNIEKKRK